MPEAFDDDSHQINQPATVKRSDELLGLESRVIFSLDASVPGATDNEVAPDIPPATINPYHDLSETESVPHRIKAVLGAGYEDFKDDPRKISSVGWVTSTVLSQFVDRTRLVLIYGPEVATNLYESTGNSLLGALAVTGLFAGVNFLVGESLTQTMDRFPGSKRQFENDFPRVVRLFSDSLAGVDEDSPPDDSLKETIEKDIPAERRPNALKRFSSSLGLHARRAGTGIGIGSTAFVATASVKGQEKSVVRKINTRVTADTSVLIFGLATLLLEGTAAMYRAGWYSTANWVSDRVEDSKTWLGIAALMIATEFISNRRAMKKMGTSPATPQIDTPQ